MYYKKHYHKMTEEILTPKANGLLNKLFNLVFESGVSVREVRLVCSLLRAKVEDTVAGCEFGGRED